MIFGFFSQKGLDALADEYIKDLPVNQRPLQYQSLRENLPYRVRVLPAHGSYLQDVTGTTRIIDLVGPSEDVPQFAVALDKKERDEIQKLAEENFAYQQDQLVVLDTGVFLRQLILEPYRRQITAKNSYSVNISNIDHPRGLGIWEHAVENMVDLFLSSYLFHAVDYKVIFGSERSRDKVIEVFQTSGLRPHLTENAAPIRELYKNVSCRTLRD